ncbi:MAG: hypothetical protein R3F62_05185 [Planctomycetota bacterium]
MARTDTPRSFSKTPAIAAGALALAFGVGAFVSASGSDGAQAAAPPRGATRTADRPARRPAELAPEPRAAAAATQVATGVTPVVVDLAEAPHAAELEGLDHGDHEPHMGCQHGPGDLKSEAEYERMRAEATAVVAAGTAQTLAALRSAQPELRSWIAGALLEDLNAFSELELEVGLRDLARDAEADLELRELVLELLGRSPASAEGTVTALGDLAQDSTLDEGLRQIALGGLRLLARERADLAQVTRAALLTSAEYASHPWMRADALDGVRTAGASPTQLAKVLDYLGDPDPSVRNGAARALGDADAPRAEAVGRALSAALERESDAAAASTILESTLRASRAHAAELLESMQASAVVRAHPELAQQVQDYLELLAAGETDPTRVIRAQHERVDARLAADAR